MIDEKELIEWLQDQCRKSEKYAQEYESSGDFGAQNYHMGMSYAFFVTVNEINRRIAPSSELLHFRKLLDEYANLDEEEKEAYWRG